MVIFNSYVKLPEGNPHNFGAQLKIKIVGQAVDYGDDHFSRFQD